MKLSLNKYFFLKRLIENFFLPMMIQGTSEKFKFSFSCGGKKVLFLIKEQWENPSDLYSKNSCNAEHDAMSYLE